MTAGLALLLLLGLCALVAWVISWMIRLLMMGCDCLLLAVKRGGEERKV